MKSLVLSLSMAALVAGMAGSAMATPLKHGQSYAATHKRVVVVKKSTHRAQIKRRTWSAPKRSIIKRMRIIRAHHARHQAHGHR